MKVIDFNVGLVSNSEVLQVLEERGSNSLGDQASGLPSERKVHEYLRTHSAGNIPRDALMKFLEAVQEFKLSKTEILQIINLKPSTMVEMYLIIQDCDERLNEEALEKLLDRTQQLLKAP
uniref:DNA-directed RNA polymerase III subunit RPC9 n=1 Tax=Tetraselmis sp. GSL018 TaxID=582737 RepID=A0A061RUZ3_9CHLO|mmetsp:Transcript_6868/g.16598  ORF Transcript_6868/g.16598 Transcript_6868/m.16598 type:complete len:120 (-) Transcript_6868:90-449(-)